MYVQSLLTALLIFNGLIYISETVKSKKRQGSVGGGGRMIFEGQLKGMSFDEEFEGGAANTLVHTDLSTFSPM